MQAFIELSDHYRRGLGVAKNPAEAVKWTRLAAERGHFIAYWTLAHMYERGEGVPKDNGQAYMWFDLVAKVQNDKSAAIYRDIVAAKITPKQIAEGQRLAGEWLARHPAQP